MRRIILTAVVVDDSSSEDDLVDGLRARLGEFYPHGSYPAVPLSVDATVLTPAGWAMLLAATEVGIEGRLEEPDEAVAEAWVALRALAGAR